MIDGVGGDGDGMRRDGRGMNVGRRLLMVGFCFAFQVACLVGLEIFPLSSVVGRSLVSIVLFT